MRKKQVNKFENVDCFGLILEALKILNDRNGDEMSHTLRLFEDGSSTLMYDGRIKIVFMSRYDTLNWASQVVKYGSYKGDK